MPAHDGASVVARVAHVGLCVADLDRARRFYCEGLGFREVARLESASAHTRAVLQQPEADIRASFVERDGLRLELLSFVTPGTLAGERPRATNRIGFTHLALRVRDLDDAVALLVRVGGEPVDETRMDNARVHARAIVVLDPDGNRVELIEAPGDPAASIGVPVS